MFRSIKAAFMLDLRSRYSGALSALAEPVVLLGGLVVYRLTADAFGDTFSGNLTAYGADYFTYVLLGELGLLIPLRRIDGMVQAVRSSSAQGTLEALTIVSKRVQSPVLVLGTAGLLHDLMQFFFTALAAAVLFRFPLDPARLLGVLGLQLLALPLFLGLAMIASAATFALGRGYGAVGHLLSVATILAGAYFPVGVLPENLQRIGNAVSPFNFLLESARVLYASGIGDPRVAFGAARVVTLGFVAFIAGYWALGAAIRRVRRTGEIPSTA